MIPHLPLVCLKEADVITSVNATEGKLFVPRVLGTTSISVWRTPGSMAAGVTTASARPQHSLASLSQSRDQNQRTFMFPFVMMSCDLFFFSWFCWATVWERFLKTACHLIFVTLFSLCSFSLLGYCILWTKLFYFNHVDVKVLVVASNEQTVIQFLQEILMKYIGPEEEHTSVTAWSKPKG